MTEAATEQSDAPSEHVRRIRDALSELGDWAQENIVEEPEGDADVRVRVPDHMENALFNNGEWAAFHGAGYVGHHVDCDEEFVDLRQVEQTGEDDG